MWKALRYERETIVERHGGTIGASSEDERAVFTVRLPCEAPRDSVR